MIDFTPGQRKTIATGITLMALAFVLAFVGLVGWLLLHALSLAAGAIVPVFAGMLLALFFRPYFVWWKNLVKNPALATVLMSTTILLPLAAACYFAGAALVHQASTLVEQAPEKIREFVEWFNANYPNVKHLADQLDIPYAQWPELYKIKAARAGASMISSLGGVLSGLVTIVFFFYFLTRPVWRGNDYVREMPFLKPETRVFVCAQIDAFQDIVVGFFQRQTVICLIEGLYYGLVFWLINVPFGFILGFMLGTLNLVPLFGSVVCLPIVLLQAYFGDGGTLMRMFWALGGWVGGQVLDGYLITPKIQGDKTGLGYAGVIFSFFFWGSVIPSTLLGLLLAIPLSAFCVVLWRGIKQRYIRPVI